MSHGSSRSFEVDASDKAREAGLGGARHGCPVCAVAGPHDRPWGHCAGPRYRMRATSITNGGHPRALDTRFTTIAMIANINHLQGRDVLLRSSRPDPASPATHMLTVKPGFVEWLTRLPDGVCERSSRVCPLALGEQGYSETPPAWHSCSDGHLRPQIGALGRSPVFC